MSIKFEQEVEELSTFDKMVEFLDLSWDAKHTIVPCLIGPVGIGKTAAVMQHAKNVGAGKIVTIIASQILPNEVSGITMPESKTKSMEIYDHYKLSSLEDGDILFFDELLEADQYVLSACLTLIESRMMMSGKLLPDIQIIAATNPTVMPTAIKVSIRQRFMFQSFEPRRDEVGDYIESQFGFRPCNSILAMVTDDSDYYNVLSPRSLTKLCEWLSTTPKDNRKAVAKMINNMWGETLHGIGSTLLSDLNGSLKNEEKTIATDKLFEILDQLNIERAELEGNIGRILKELQASERWEEIAGELAKIDMRTLLDESE